MTTSKLFSFMFALTLLTSCTTTTTKRKDPAFVDMAKVQQQLVGLITAENINLNGKEITTNNKTTSELEVSITNAQNISTNEEERNQLGKSIATAIKSNLKNTSEFKTYKVLFITKTETGGVKKRTWVGKVYSATEL
jgi:hypothetical protein